MTSRWRVLWTRGEGCEELADLLGAASSVQGDLRTACLATRADLLVQRKLTSFDLVGTAVPQGFQSDGVREVVAAVGGGPHSRLAGQIAQRIAEAVDVEGRLVTGSREADEDEQAHRMLKAVAADAPRLRRELIKVGGAGDLLASLSGDALLVVGAPGGSWFQRQFFGPGRQLIRSAPGGVIVVRSSPRRCFQDAGPVEALSPMLSVGEANRLATSGVVPVADGGRLVGLFRVGAEASANATVADVMEEPVFVSVDDPVEAVGEVCDFFDDSPIPIVDRDGGLYGVISQK